MAERISIGPRKPRDTRPRRYDRARRDFLTGVAGEISKWDFVIKFHRDGGFTVKNKRLKDA